MPFLEFKHCLSLRVLWYVLWNCASNRSLILCRDQLDFIPLTLVMDMEHPLSLILTMTLSVPTISMQLAYWIGSVLLCLSVPDFCVVQVSAIMASTSLSSAVPLALSGQVVELSCLSTPHSSLSRAQTAKCCPCPLQC